MKNYFWYGYDPCMIGMTIVILIVEALGFFLCGESAYDPFADIPFWLLTLYIISMIAMFLTACFIKNDAVQDEKCFYKSPFNLLAIGILVLALILAATLKNISALLSFCFTLLIPISLGISTIGRKNWIAFIFCLSTISIQLVICISL